MTEIPGPRHAATVGLELHQAIPIANPNAAVRSDMESTLSYAPILVNRRGTNRDQVVLESALGYCLADFGQIVIPAALGIAR